MSHSPTIGGSSCHVILADLNQLEDRLDEYSSYLSETESERAHRFVNQQLRDSFALAHGWLREQLSGYLNTAPAELRFDSNQYGKPFLIGGELQFNLSHSKQRVALVVSQKGDVGIDIQHHDTKVELAAIAKRFFATEEAAWFDATPEAERLSVFYKIWSLKEAYIKAVGMGMSLPLSSFAFAENAAGEVVLVREPKESLPAKWCASYHDTVADYALAVVTETVTSTLFIPPLSG
ncbi:MAG: 4'-phosphopantetheinyl transferase superfamily protein [Coxiellaceae bacterium]|nr:4'-phosphopantetheinyl transferase superfamily protein [Coxiellaceae bacterium]